MRTDAALMLSCTTFASTAAAAVLYGGGSINVAGAMQPCTVSCAVKATNNRENMSIPFFFFFLANSCQSVAVLMTCRQMSLSLAFLQAV